MTRTFFLIFAAVALTFASSSSRAQVFFGPNMPDVTVDEHEKSQAISALVENLEKYYVFPDVADKTAKAIQQWQSTKEYGAMTSAKQFSETLTKLMSDIAHDRHLRVTYSHETIPPMPPPPDPGKGPPPMDARQLLHMRKQNYELKEVEWLSGNVGLLRLDAFLDPDSAGDALAGAMAFLANTDALIIDLRNNHGGSPWMVALLASYFVGGENPVRLNDLSFRRPGTSESEIQQSWTLPHVPGRRYLDKQVYILTSRSTFSAGEGFTYDLQTMKRAIVVGEPTGGGANPGMVVRLTDHLGAFLPRGRAINPVTKTNWDGVGVQPDIKVSPQDALKTAHREAIQHLIEKETDEQELARLKRALATVDSDPTWQPSRGPG